MANIRTGALLEQKSREFKAASARMDRFREDFQDCVNDVIQQINLYADLDTAIAPITNTEGTIGIDELYRYPFTQLLSLRIFEQGQRPARGGDQFYADLKREKSDYLDSIRQGLLDAEMDSDDDDDTYDIVGLGALG